MITEIRKSLARAKSALVKIKGEKKDATAKDIEALAAWYENSLGFAEWMIGEYYGLTSLAVVSAVDPLETQYMDLDESTKKEIYP